MRSSYPIYSDTKGAWQADLMFILYTNQGEETRLHTFLCIGNINTECPFVRQCNFGGKKIDDKDFNPKGPNQKVLRKAKPSSKTSSQKIYQRPQRK